MAVQHPFLQLQNGSPISRLIMCGCCYLGREVHDADVCCCGRFESGCPSLLKHYSEPFLCSCCCFLLIPLLGQQVQARVAVVTLYLINLVLQSPLLLLVLLYLILQTRHALPSLLHMLLHLLELLPHLLLHLLQLLHLLLLLLQRLLHLLELLLHPGRTKYGRKRLQPEADPQYASTSAQCTTARGLAQEYR